VRVVGPFLALVFGFLPAFRLWAYQVLKFLSTTVFPLRFSHFFNQGCEY
jgi:hypothetical protein